MFQKSVLRRKRRRGVSLLEVVIALFILTMASLSVMALGVFSTRVERQSEARSAAMAVARTKMDELIRVTQANRVPKTNEPITLSPEMKKSLPDGAEVAASYSILPWAGSRNIQDIVVTVQWRNMTAEGEPGPWTSVSVSRTVNSVLNLEWLPTNGWDPKPIDQLFYTPPPPSPPPSSTGTGSTGGSTGTSTTGGTTSEISTTGEATATAGFEENSQPSTTGTSQPPRTTGFLNPYGSKWR